MYYYILRVNVVQLYLVLLGVAFVMLGSNLVSSVTLLVEAVDQGDNQRKTLQGWNVMNRTQKQPSIGVISFDERRRKKKEALRLGS